MNAVRRQLSGSPQWLSFLMHFAVQLEPVFSCNPWPPTCPHPNASVWSRQPHSCRWPKPPWIAVKLPLPTGTTQYRHWQCHWHFNHHKLTWLWLTVRDDINDKGPVSCAGAWSQRQSFRFASHHFCVQAKNHGSKLHALVESPPPSSLAHFAA